MFLNDLLLFGVFQLIFVYPLGKCLLDLLNIKLWYMQALIFSLSIGMVILTLFTLILGYTNNYELLPLLVLISPVLLLIQIRKISWQGIDIRKFINKSDIIVVFSILICVLIQSIIVFPNGINSDGFLRLKGVFTEDGMWHIALINNLIKSIPPENPVYYGEKLLNYNYFSDIYIAVIHKFTSIEILTLYFKLIGPFLAFLCASLLYFVLKVLTGSKLISSLGVLLVTLGCTYYYVFGFFKPDLNITPSTFFGNDYVSRMVNYQLSFSYIIITTFTFLLLVFEKINNFRFIMVTSLLIASGIGFKSYGTILVIAALYLIGFFKLFKKEFGYIKIAVLSSIFTLILIKLFLQNTNAIEAVFKFEPFWIIRNMFSDPLRLNSPAWEAQKNWYYQNSNYIGIMYLYLKGIVIFLFTGLGLKLLGFFSFIQIHEDRKREVVLILAIVAFIGIVIPLTFTQSGVKWNTVQFIWYSGFSLGILLVVLISNLCQKINIKFTLILIFFIWTSFLSGVYFYSNEYLSNKDNLSVYNFKGTQESFRAARFLSSQPSGIILLDSVYSKTPFIVAISGKNAFFADQTILSNLSLDWYDRSKQVDLYFSGSQSLNYERNFLLTNNISYIFTGKNALKSRIYLKNIYNNKEISIYRAQLK